MADEGCLGRYIHFDSTHIYECGWKGTFHFAVLLSLLCRNNSSNAATRTSSLDPVGLSLSVLPLYSLFLLLIILHASWWVTGRSLTDRSHRPASVPRSTHQCNNPCVAGNGLQLEYLWVRRTRPMCKQVNAICLNTRAGISSVKTGDCYLFAFSNTRTLFR